MEFRRTDIISFNRSGKPLTDEEIHWKQFTFPSTIKEGGPVTYVHSSSSDPNVFAVTCANKVQVYDASSITVSKSITRFRKAAYHGVLRNDGQLLLVAGEEGILKLFAVESKTQLRLYKGHQKPVHSCCFMNSHNQIASFGDDNAVKVWDIPTEKQLASFEEHSDFARAGVSGHINSNLVISGSHDGSCRVWDIRSKKCSMVLSHGSAVESLLLYPTDSLLVSAGGTSIKVWDLSAGGKLLSKFSQHHKPVTSLRFCSNQKRLLSASLDKHVKIYDLKNFDVLATLKFPAPILSMDISANDKHIVVGMTDNLVSIQSAKNPVSEESEEINKNIFYKNKALRQDHTVTTVVVSDAKSRDLPRYDQYLRTFQHAKALDSVLTVIFYDAIFTCYTVVFCR